MEFKITSISIRLVALLMVLILGFSSCKEEPKTPPSTTKIAPVRIPVFNQDSAFAFLEKQLSFGYRIPGTPESRACKDWMVAKLKSYGASVAEQNFKADFLSVKGADATNVIATFNPKLKSRVLLCAHYDSRLVAEKDKDESMQNKPIPGADDGASGTAALLEIARVLNENPIDLGVDIVLFDAEDQGENNGAPTTWCLGSQYWTKNPHKRGYTANFGILLDMIAAKGAIFYKEGHSMTYAAEYTNKIWKLAQGMGYGDLFQNQRVGGITDDHYYININLGIPTVDIINTAGVATGVTFGAYHHTHNDNMENINKRNLKIVGQVVTATVYKTYDRSFQRIQ